MYPLSNAELGFLFREHEIRSYEEEQKRARLSEDEKKLKRIADEQHERIGRKMFPSQHDGRIPYCR